MSLSLSGTTGVPPSGVGFMVGQVCMFAQQTPPSGFLKANGQAVSRTQYSALFAIIGTTYGAGNGSTTFNLPDLRGEFLRGWDDGRGVDAGRAFGSTQTDALQGHTHTYNAPVTGPYAGGAGGLQSGLTGQYTGSPVSDGVNGTPRTAAETRPRNAAVLACIFAGV